MTLREPFGAVILTRANSAATKKPLSNTKNGTDASFKIVIHNSALVIRATSSRFASIAVHNLAALDLLFSLQPVIKFVAGFCPSRLIKFMGAPRDLILIRKGFAR